MISKSKRQLIKSLAHSKFRKKHGLFVAEGPKLVKDLMPTFKAKLVFATGHWLKNNPIVAEEIFECTQEEIKGCSLQPSSREVLIVFNIKNNTLNLADINSTLSIALDSIQDPGNLGTIIRVADWFGIHHIICSADTVDVFNPKVIQSTMGSLARVNVYYTNLAEIISEIDAPVYGTFLEGDDIYQTKLEKRGIIIMGNEGKGISKEMEALVSHKLYIPSFPIDSHTAESLNVAMATGIICSEFRRR